MKTCLQKCAWRRMESLALKWVGHWINGATLTQDWTRWSISGLVSRNVLPCTLDEFTRLLQVMSPNAILAESVDVDLLYTTTFRPSLCLFLRLKKEIHEIQSGVREQWRQQGRVMHTGVDRETPYLNFKIIPAFDRSQKITRVVECSLHKNWILKQMNTELERLKAFWSKWMVEWSACTNFEGNERRSGELEGIWSKWMMEWSVCRHFEANECWRGEIEGILKQTSDGVERF